MGEILYSQSGMVDAEGGKSTNNLQVKRNLKSQAVTIQNTATAIPSTPLQYRRGLLIENNSSNPVYIGGADVSTINGFPIYPRGVLKIDVSEDVTIYGVSAAGGDEVRICEGA